MVLKVMRTLEKGVAALKNEQSFCIQWWQAETSSEEMHKISKKNS